MTPPEQAAPSYVEIPVRMMTIPICDLCLNGAGGECHVPGCGFFLNRAPDIPLRSAALAAQAPHSPAVAHAMARFWKKYAERLAQAPQAEPTQDYKIAAAAGLEHLRTHGKEFLQDLDAVPPAAQKAEPPLGYWDRLRAFVQANPHATEWAAMLNAQKAEPSLVLAYLYLAAQQGKGDDMPLNWFLCGEYTDGPTTHWQPLPAPPDEPRTEKP